MLEADCRTRAEFETKLGSELNWPILISKKSRLQQPLQPSNKDGQLRNRSPPEPDWIKIQKELVLELAPKYRDVVRGNALPMLSYGLLYLDIADACRNG